MSAKAIIIEKPTGFKCLFNESGKLAFMSQSQFEVYKKANKWGMKIVNNNSQIGVEIRKRIEVK